MALAHDAFISYSHAADGKLALALESGLEKLARPWLRLRAVDVFRDETSLAANPGLWRSIVEHLGGSKWFLLMASPQSAASLWCTREVQWWLDNRSAEQMLIVLTDGELCWDRDGGDFDWTRTTALSTALKGRLAEEPLYVDLRWTRARREKLALNHMRFRQAILDIAAPIRGVPKDQLDGEDVRQMQRSKRIAWSGVAAISVLFLAAAFAGWEAMSQRDVAEVQRDVALSRQLAAQSAGALEKNPDRALLLAREAILATAPRKDGWFRLGLRRETRTVAETSTFEARSALLAALKKTDGIYRLLMKPWTQFYHVAFSADGARLVLGDVGGTVYFVDPAAWKLQSEKRLSYNFGLFGQLSRDGRSAIALHERVKGTIVVVDIETGKRVGAPLNGHRDLPGIALSADGRVLAAQGQAGSLRIWDVARSAEKQAPLQVAGEELFPVALSTDGARLAAATEKGQLILWNLAQGKRAGKPFPGNPGDPVGAFSPDGRLFAASNTQGDRLVLRDASTGRTVVELDQKSHAAALAFDSSGRLLASATYDGRISVWDLRDERPGVRVLRLGPQVRGLVFSPDARQLVSVSQEGEIVAWDLAMRESLSTELLRGTWHAGAAFSPDGTLLAAAGVGGIWLFDVAARRPNGDPLQAETSFDNSIDFSPDGRRLASAHGQLRKIMLWDIGTRHALGALAQFKDGVIGAKFSADGRVLAVHVDEETATTLWSPDSLELLGVLDGVHVEPVASIAFAHRQPLVATAGYDGQLVVWSLETKRPVAGPWKPLFSETEPPEIVWWANDEFLLTNTLEARSAKDGRVLDPARSFGKLAVSPVTHRVAVGLEEIELWQVHGNNRWAGPTLSLQDKAWALAFSPDGRVLATGDRAGFLRIWDLDVESWLAMACRIANRNLTSAEWAEAFDVPYRRTCPQFPDPPPEPQRVF